MAGVYKNRQCIFRRRNTFVPNDHQEYVKNYFLSSRHKGLLLYHKLGSGKTCTSILIADAMLQQGLINKVYVITPGSLRENWISEYCRVCGNPSITLENFVFITNNYKVKDQVMKLDFNSLVIIDEVHNLVNGVKNFSTNTYAIYYKIINSNCRVLALSGTPVFNNTIEFAILANMLSNKFDWVLINGGLKQVEEGKASWDMAGWAVRKQNPVLTKQLISGIVSFYGGDQSAYPDVRYIEPFKCPMSLHQYQAYLDIERSEELRRKNPPSIKLKFDDPEKYKKDFITYIIAVQWTSTRAASNCLKTKFYNFIPDMYDTGYLIYTMDKFKEILAKLPNVVEEETVLTEDAQVVTDDKGKPVTRIKANHVEQIINNLKQRNGILFGDISVPFKYLLYDDNKKIRVYGWMTDEILREPRTTLFNMSQKYSTLLTNIVLNPNQKHIIFSFYKTTRGTLMLYSLLSHCGIKAKLYSGDVPAMRRQRMIDIFNHPSNSEGQHIQVMLLTEAGGEGISLLGVNHVHIVESSIKENKNIQAIGRAVRYKSHVNLPEERNFVNVYRYWSVWNRGPGESPVVGDAVQIDQQLYDQHFSKEGGKKTALDEFQTLMENYSIEEIGPGDAGGEMGSDQGWEEQKLEEEIDIEVEININGINHIINIPASFSIEDTTNFLIANYLLPPLRIRDTILTNVLIDLNIVSENSPPFEPDSSSVDVNSQNKMVEYIEGNLILYTYNIEDVDIIPRLIFTGPGRFSLKNLPSNITVSQAIEGLKRELETFYRGRYDNISIDEIRLFEKDKRKRLTDETNLLIYFLNKKPIEYEITTSQAKRI